MLKKIFTKSLEITLTWEYSTIFFNTEKICVDETIDTTIPLNCKVIQYSFTTFELQTK